MNNVEIKVDNKLPEGAEYLFEHIDQEDQALQQSINNFAYKTLSFLMGNSKELKDDDYIILTWKTLGEKDQVDTFYSYINSDEIINVSTPSMIRLIIKPRNIQTQFIGSSITLFERTK